jgi:hypothetical protein
MHSAPRDVHAGDSRFKVTREATLGTAYVDDTDLIGNIEPAFIALADAVRSFKQDADLEVCLSQCKIYMPGMQEERAHQLIMRDELFRYTASAS